MLDGRSDSDARRPSQAHGQRDAKGHARSQGFLSRGFVHKPGRILENSMTRTSLSRSIVNLLTKLAVYSLEQADQEAICGDLAESGVSGLPALRDVMSLAVRRQAARLRNLSQSIVVALLVVTLGYLLSIAARQISDESAIYLWFFTDNRWDWTLVQNPGFRQGFLETMQRVFLSYLALASWSWTAGLLVGAKSRHRRLIVGCGFLAVLCGSMILGVPAGFGSILYMLRGRDFPGNAVVFSNTFYRHAFPLVLQGILVFLPAWHGMNFHAKKRSLPFLQRAILLLPFSATLGTLAIRNLNWLRVPQWAQPIVLHDSSLALLATLAPAFYLLLIAIRSRVARRITIPE